jgi:hypothetical protein
MGILVEYQDAKRGLITQKMPDDLEDAVEQFAFNQLSFVDRIALVLAGVFGGEAEQYSEQAAELSFYAKSGFVIPYKVPQKSLDVTMKDILS